MNAIRNCIFLTGCLLTLTCITHAQNAREDFIRINEAYLKAGPVSMDIRYALYNEVSDKKPAHELKGTLKAKGSMKYYHVNNTETIDNEQFQLVVNHAEKRMSMRGKYGVQATASGGLSLVDLQFLDSAISRSRKITYNKGMGTACYTIVFADGVYKEARIEFDRKNYFIHKLVFIYAGELATEGTPKKMEIGCTNIRIGDELADDVFDTARFVKKGRTRYFPADHYKTYKLTDLYTRRKSIASK